MQKSLGGAAKRKVMQNVKWKRKIWTSLSASEELTHSTTTQTQEKTQDVSQAMDYAEIKMRPTQKLWPTYTPQNCPASKTILE